MACALSPLHSQNANAADKPAEYEESELPAALRETLRFGIIAAGSFPIAFGLSSVIVNASAPQTWSSNQNIQVSLISAGSLAFSVALTDLIIGLVQKSKQNKNNHDESKQQPAN